MNSMRTVYTQEEVIKKFNEIHNNKYNYNKVIYKGITEKVTIVCPIHGEFEQSARSHMRGSGCPECGRISTHKDRIKGNQKFIEQSEQIHGHKYDYSKVMYKNNKEKVTIICPIHGEFLQAPIKHINGQGCPKCYGNVKKTTEDFINEAISVHKDKYDYSKSDYKGTNEKICIICPIHGEFWQTPKNHVRRKQGCPECKKKKISESETKSYEIFKQQAREKHNNKYKYDETTYISSREKIKIICTEHGEFYQQVDSHLRGCGCPVCVQHISKAENDIVDFIKQHYNGKVVRNDRTILEGRELDIYLPEMNLAIEYNGMIWHSEKFNKDKNYHLNKLIECNNKDIRLIHIYEYEYINKKDIVENKLLHLINKRNDLPKIYGRKCYVKLINKDEAKKFLNENHIQGYAKSSIHLGCFYNDRLIGVMSFKRELSNCDNWELTRFATDKCYVCCGVGGKLFKWFIENYKPNKIKSFADRRWTLDKDNNLYTKLGFKLDKILKPDYRYTRGQYEYIHKFNFRKKTLLERYPDRGLTEDMTEYEMSQKLGFYRIWDCGLFKYVWKKLKGE